VIANRTLDAYGQSVKLYELQFNYGQTSQMTVAQVQSQYETAAAQIPQIESQIAQTENALSILLGRNPGPIPRGKSIYDLALPACRPACPRSYWSAARTFCSRSRRSSPPMRRSARRAPCISRPFR
jgi:multidrug efflux system outer membrane protein